MSRARRWQLAPATDAGARLAAALEVSPLLGQLLVNRGIDDVTRAAPFLDGRLSEHLRSPMLFRDMARASGRVADALAAGERIGIYGDYDVDGVSGSALLLRFLRAVGARPEPLVHIPHRLREGYGMSATGIERLAAGGARVMITVDCGAVSHGEIALANARGMDVIVCDHHQVAESRPPAYAILNPIEPDGGFPFRRPVRHGRRVLPRAGRAHAPARAGRGRCRTCAASSTWWRSARSPTSCRCSRRIASW